MGKEQAAIATLAIATGGNVRVGTEDYPFISDGVPARNNAELIERIVTIARFMGREVATPVDARKMIGGRV
jgi:3-keto-5-aminohexanoate cleavage enzyme